MLTMIGWVLITISLLLKGCECEDQSIPEYLLECYKDRDILLPLNIDVFIDILRKVETSPYFLMDIGSFVDSLLDRFWRDGIELDRNIIVVDPGVIPYKTTGFESYKYEVITRYIVPKTGRDPRAYHNFFENGVLSLSERCTLHHMLSRSVDLWERGNEYYVCRNFIENDITNSQTTGFRKSSCPVEKGVMNTKNYGTVSLSNVLIAIAATLKPMEIPLTYVLEDAVDHFQNESISNKWVSIMGDLSELFIMQTPLAKKSFSFGPDGTWNDTDVPIEYYMTLSTETLRNKLWQFTDAEILGAIDGLMMVEEALKWISYDHSLRLSQLFEAFYTKDYKDYSVQAHACQRQTFYERYLENNPIMLQQVRSYAAVLIENMPNYFYNESIVQSKSGELVSEFNDYVSNLLSKKYTCSKEVNLRPKLDVNIIIDNSWTSFDSLKFVMALGKYIDVSVYGSQLSLIQGDDGQLVTDRVNSIGGVYLFWSRACVNGTPSLPRSLITLRDTIISRQEAEISVTAYAQVTIIIAISTILTDSDLTNSIILLRSIRKENPDMIFLYVTTRPLAPMFVRLTTVLGSLEDKIITVNENEHTNRLLDELTVLEKFPRAIKPQRCSNMLRQNQAVKMTEYANPGTILFYRIHPCYLTQTNMLNIEILNQDKGNIIVCTARDEDENEKDCKEASIKEKIIFNIQNPCPSRNGYGNTVQWEDNCKPVYIKISGKRSFSTCSEMKCRMADDIPFEMSIYGLKCIKGYPICNGSGLLEHSLMLTIIVNIFVFLLGE